MPTDAALLSRLQSLWSTPPEPEPLDDLPPAADPFPIRPAAAPRRRPSTLNGFPPGYLDPARPRLCRFDTPKFPPWCA